MPLPDSCDPAGDAVGDAAGEPVADVAGEALGDPTGDGVDSGDGLVVGDGEGVPIGTGTDPGPGREPGTGTAPASRTTRIGRSSDRGGRFRETGTGVLCGRAMPTDGPLASAPPGTTTASCGPPATNGVRGWVEVVSDADPASTAASVGTDARVTSSPTTIGYRRATPVERCRAIVRGSGADTQRLLRISGPRLDAGRGMPEPSETGRYGGQRRISSGSGARHDPVKRVPSF
jgi:hypothetical protein